MAPRTRSAVRLAEEVERLLHRTVGEAEQHRLLRRLERIGHPARHDEMVARLEVEGLVADLHLAAALDYGETRAVGGAVRLAAETLRQQLDRGADGGHRPAAGRGIGEAHLVAVARV